MEELNFWKKRLVVAQIKKKIAENTLNTMNLNYQLGLEENQDEDSMNQHRINIEHAKELVSIHQEEIEHIQNVISSIVGE